jgi:hypothetical protein
VRREGNHLRLSATTEFTEITEKNSLLPGVRGVLGGD